MEANNFKNSIRDRFDGFSSTAPESVWSGIEANLDAEKRKTGILWWTFAFIALLGFGRSLILSETEPIQPNADATIGMAGNISQFAENQTTTKNFVSTTEVPTTEKTVHSHVNNTLKTPPSKNSSLLKSPSKKQIPAPKPETIAKNKGQKIESFNSRTPTALEPLKLSSMSPNEQFEKNFWILPCAYNNYVPRRKHLIGVDVNTFINLADPRGFDDSANQFLWSQNNGPSGYSYNRPFELEAYYQTRMENSASSFTARLMFAKSQASFEQSSYTIIAKGNNLGTGIGYQYQILQRRLQLHGYGILRGEFNFGKNTLSPQSSLNPTTSPLTDPNSESFAKNNGFQQFLVSGEVGLTADYYFSPQFKIRGSLGYRNYFVQQDDESAFLVRVPQLLRIGLGCSWEFR